MNYLAAAKERNLDLAQLPKTLQKKIQELESLNAEFLESKVPKEKLNPKELESYNMIQEKIEELDAFLVKKVKNFDATKYQARLDSFNKMMEQRKSKKGEDGIDAIIDDGGIADLKESVQIEPEKFEPQEVKAAPVQVQEPVQVREPEPKPEPQQQVEEEYEVEEFDKVGDAKPKKVVSKGMLLMGVGFLLLTWGAVNVFKDRRG